MFTLPQRKLLRVRAEEVCPEIGVLMLAFSPLDRMAWQELPQPGVLMLRFMLAGSLLLGLALASELGRLNERR